MPLSFIDRIKKLESKPRIISLFSNAEIDQLIELNKSLPTTVYNKEQKVIKKRWLQNYNKDLDKLYIKKLGEIIGDFKMDNLKSDSGEDFFGLFQESFAPLKLHVDSGFDLNSILYKQALIPLSDGETVIFKNKWYELSTNFTIDKKELDNANITQIKGRNKRSSNHINLYDKTDFDMNLYKKYLRHENIDNLKGLKILMVYKWKIGDILIWDRTNLHCSSCNIDNKKLSLTTFTKK